VDDLKTRRFIVMIYRTTTGYCAGVPDLPGCVSTGMTVEHVRQMIAEAISLHLEGMQEDGESIPEPRQKIEFAIDEDAGEELCTWVGVELPAAVEAPSTASRPQRTPRRRPAKR
jgi:predicted RNase H-like HicB family nuclease